MENPTRTQSTPTIPMETRDISIMLRTLRTRTMPP